MTSLMPCIAHRIKFPQELKVCGFLATLLFNYSQASSRRLTHDNVPYVLINFLCAPVDFLCGFADFLCSLVDPLRAPIDRHSGLVDALLYRCLPNALDCSLGEVRDTYLIVCDGIGQILDEAIQRVGTIGILQELQQSVFLR